MSLFSDWREQMRVGIQCSVIANMVRDHTREGRGAPVADDMSRFREEAGAVADLWDETVNADLDTHTTEGRVTGGAAHAQDDGTQIYAADGRESGE